MTLETLLDELGSIKKDTTIDSIKLGINNKHEPWFTIRTKPNGLFSKYHNDIFKQQLNIHIHNPDTANKAVSETFLFISHFGMCASRNTEAKTVGFYPDSVMTVFIKPNSVKLVENILNDISYQTGLLFKLEYQ